MYSKNQINKSKKKTILITGGAGYIGSHIAYACAQANYHVVVLDSFIHDQIFNPPWADVYAHDFANTTVLTHIFTHYTICAVIHCAASIEVAQSLQNPLAYYDNNVAKTITLLMTMQKFNCNKIIFSSSCAVYGQPQTDALCEEHPQQPLSPYGQSKKMIEIILADCARAYDLRFIAMRYFNAAGALPEQGLGEQHNHETHIIPLLLRAAYEHIPFIVYGNDYQTKDGTAIRDYVHVLDIAQAHILALEHLALERPSDYFNIGTGKGSSVKQLVTMVEKVCKIPIKTIIQKRRAGDANQLLADPTKAHTILQWKPRYSDLEFIIKSAHAFACLPKKIITLEESRI